VNANESPHPQLLSQCAGREETNGGTTRIPRILQTAVTAAFMLTTLATPARSAPATSTAVECSIAPRSQAALETLLASTGIATPPATTDGETLPEGAPAEPGEADEIANTVAEWLACQNAGEQLRAWALFSDGYLYRLLSRQGGLTANGYDALATPSPSPGDPATLQEIRDSRGLPDGRLGATVTISYPSVPMPKRFFFFFTREGGRLVIDGILGEISFSVP
jgi:hypothetical protein